MAAMAEEARDYTDCVDEPKWPAAAQRKLKDLTHYQHPPLSWGKITENMKEFPWMKKAGSSVPRSENMCRTYFWKRQKEDGWTKGDARRRLKPTREEELTILCEEQAREIEELRSIISNMTMQQEEEEDEEDAPFVADTTPEVKTEL